MSDSQSANIASVSVVVPYYRAQATIARAVRSVIAQIIQPCEIIVIDDGSPDDPSGVLAEFGPMVTLLRKANGGTASARNVGIDRARGEWIAFLDADDYWEPVKLERQLAVRQQHPEVGLIGSRWFREMPGCPREIEAWCDPALFDKVLRTAGPIAFQLAMYLWTSSLLIRRDVIGDERFVSGLEPAEDRDFWIRLVQKTPALILSEPLATYVQEPGGISRSDIDRDCRNMLQVVHRHAQLLGAAGLREHEGILYRRWASVYLLKGNPRAAVAPALQRLKRTPLSPQAWWVVARSTVASLWDRHPVVISE